MLAGVTLVISSCRCACVMFGEQRQDARRERQSWREVQSMSSKASSWLAAAGSIMMLLALCFLPAALRDRSDTNIRGMGICLFSAGSLIASLGTYFKAWALRSGIVAAKAAPEATAKRKPRGGCDLCGTETPVVLCTVHQIHVCGTCLAQHYDQRSCAYVPSKRAGGSSKNGKPLAKAKGA